MPNLGPLFAAFNPSEPRKLVKDPVPPPEDARTVMIDGKAASINWLSRENGNNYEAGVSFNSSDHSVWKLRKEADGTFTALRCALYGRQNLSEDVAGIVAAHTGKAGER